MLAYKVTLINIIGRGVPRSQEKQWFMKVNKKESLNKSKLQAFDEHIGQSDV